MTVADSGVHSYQFHSSSNTNVAVFEDSAVLPFAAWSTNQWLDAGVYGDLNITSIDTVRRTMSGTFGITVYRSLDDQSRTITNGVFSNIPYTGSGVVIPPVPADTFRVKVAGVDFAYTSLITNTASGAINITASQAALAAPRVSIMFNEMIAPGTYPITSTTNVALYNLDASTFYISQTGTLTILENDIVNGRVRGTFDFSATGTATPPTVAFTEGYFSVEY